jgi:hypothetical protein
VPHSAADGPETGACVTRQAMAVLTKSVSLHAVHRIGSPLVAPLREPGILDTSALQLDQRDQHAPSALLVILPQNPSWRAPLSKAIAHAIHKFLDLWPNGSVDDALRRRSQILLAALRRARCGQSCPPVFRSVHAVFLPYAAILRPAGIN